VKIFRPDSENKTNAIPTMSENDVVNDENGKDKDFDKLMEVYENRDRFYETRLRPKTFRINFHPQILSKVPPQKIPI
jgi:hypothetical protein